MKLSLGRTIICPLCGGDFDDETNRMVCKACQHTVPLQEGKPVFTQPPDNLQPSQKLERGPNLGTAWRQANWCFLESQIALLPVSGIILDVGAGRGDFEALLTGHDYLTLDVYPYPETDIVCDLTVINPFRPNSFDAILLMNVLEHIFETRRFIASLTHALKPGGKLILAIPFMVKMHQEPLDFVRYTHYALDEIAAEHQLKVAQLEGYYDPMFFLGEGIGNIKFAYLPIIQGSKRYPARALLYTIGKLSGQLAKLVGQGKTSPPTETRSHAPTGYHAVFLKP